jgi:hypothetical protein
VNICLWWHISLSQAQLLLPNVVSDYIKRFDDIQRLNIAYTCQPTEALCDKYNSRDVFSWRISVFDDSYKTELSNTTHFWYVNPGLHYRSRFWLSWWGSIVFLPPKIFRLFGFQIFWLWWGWRLFHIYIYIYIYIYILSCVLNLISTFWLHKVVSDYKKKRLDNMQRLYAYLLTHGSPVWQVKIKEIFILGEYLHLTTFW